MLLDIYFLLDFESLTEWMVDLKKEKKIREGGMEGKEEEEMERREK